MPQMDTDEDRQTLSQSNRESEWEPFFSCVYLWSTLQTNNKVP